MEKHSVIIIGAGMGGLVSALLLAQQGLHVRLFERAATPGGKLREVEIDGQMLDAGPTVFTMRWVFEEIFAACEAKLTDYLTLSTADLLARHAWSEHERLDLYADPAHSCEAIGDFAGAKAARGFQAFCLHAQQIFAKLDKNFIRAARPTPWELTRKLGIHGLTIQPFHTLWQKLGEYFPDPRLRQLFGRYATYSGSSPFLAPATLMLIAHVEQSGVWLVKGGMHQLAVALAKLARERGVKIEYNQKIAEILINSNGASGVILSTGEVVTGDAVIFNGDPAALAAGYLGTLAQRAVKSIKLNQRSLSALTWNLVATTSGFPLTHHNVFFTRDYQAEFKNIFSQGMVPNEGTVYVCAQDRGNQKQNILMNSERLFFLLNAPARGDLKLFDAAEIASCKQRVFSLLAKCGLTIQHSLEKTQVTTPTGFEQLFPATGGALYGQATHGWQASFTRPGTRTRIPRLYLAGGATHPGAGIPMAALSGRLAATSVLADLASTSR